MRLYHLKVVGPPRGCLANLVLGEGRLHSGAHRKRIYETGRQLRRTEQRVRAAIATETIAANAIIIARFIVVFNCGSVKMAAPSLDIGCFHISTIPQFHIL